MTRRLAALAVALAILLGSGARGDAPLAPDPARHADAVVQVYHARTWGWRGALATHPWIAVKEKDAAIYTRYEVIGWRMRYGGEALSISHRAPDAPWAGNAASLLVDLRGEAAAAAIPRIKDAVARYPYKDRYQTWPGPNSNTFVAWVGREVPELGLDLPPTAIGKDFLPEGAVLAKPVGGPGLQLSLFGLAGVTLGLEEGVEINLLGLVFGVDLNAPGIKLPFLGRIGF
ncbi:MAG: DUF3750 domain-containing protein [Alphaproteobacteria bacterium]|nr:DUF3750 domain-containing protein [Alphaproteobacteria bacterium]